MPVCIHGIEQVTSDGRRWFEQQSACESCNAGRREFLAEVQALEQQLRESLPSDDDLHPDNYHGPYGMLWFQAAGFRLAAMAGSR